MSTVIAGFLSFLAFIHFTAWREYDPCVTKHTVPVNGIAMHVDVYECQYPKEPETLLLLHGGGATLDTYYRNLPELSHHFPLPMIGNPKPRVCMNLWRQIPVIGRPSLRSRAACGCRAPTTHLMI